MLTVRCHGAVVGPDSQEDKSRCISSSTERFYFHPGNDPSKTQSSQGLGDGPSRRKTPGPRTAAFSAKASQAQEAGERLILNLGQKIHYRIVFNEIGIPLTQLRSMTSAFKALRQVAHCTLLTLWSAYDSDTTKFFGSCTCQAGYIVTSVRIISYGWKRWNEGYLSTWSMQNK